MAFGDVLRHPLVRKVLQEGEERLGRTVGKVLADARFASGVQLLLAGAIRTRAAVERGVDRALRAANVPSRADLDALRAKIEELEAAIGAGAPGPGRGGARGEGGAAPSGSAGRRRSGDGPPPQPRSAGRGKPGDP